MAATLKALGEQVKKARLKRSLTVPDLSRAVPSADVTDIDRLESAENLPRREVLEALVGYLGIAERYWRPLVAARSSIRREFEVELQEMVGRPVSLDSIDSAGASAADRVLKELLAGSLTSEQAHALFNRLLVFYGVEPTSKEFFDHYLGPRAFTSDARLEEAIDHYQIDAIRLFSSLSEAFRALNQGALTSILGPLGSRSDEIYRARRPWTSIIEIEEERLPDLGYISAEKVRRERDERTVLSEFLKDLAAKLEAEGPPALTRYSQDRLRRMDSLMRQFTSTIPHGFLSPLFVPDADALRRESERLGPKDEQDLSRMEKTQAEAMENLSNYLTADHMDVYVATSMRTKADFVSVNRFVQALFGHPEVASLNLRFFNPTQSWIEDRVAKGLVEALMLRRSAVTVYMAQKEDTFGKDSEASVALGQGKPVIVFVPRLYNERIGIDSAQLGLLSRTDIAALVEAEGTLPSDKELDATFDKEALHARLLTIRLERAQSSDFEEIARSHWADFDLYGESDRLADEAQRRVFRSWLDAVVGQNLSPTLPQSLVESFLRMLVAITMRFERRAQIFREIHPLALQVILSTGVLNGILVVRDVETCADLLGSLLRNELRLELQKDENNYRVVEARTKSTVRVISRHQLLSNAFKTYYARG